MKTSKGYQEKTAADDKSVGFEYQYYYFLYRLLQLKSNETIGLEVLDDVHLEHSNGELVLMQLKHSIQTSANGKIINFRERDVDLWKTLFNWINVIKDKNSGRGTEKEQFSYISNTSFLLISNKQESYNNEFMKSVKELHEKKINITVFKQKISSVIVSTKKSDSNKDLLLYMNTFIAQDDEWLEKFLSKVSFELDQDNLIEKIKDIIKYEKLIDENRVIDVLHSLDSSLRIDNYINIKQKNKINISCEDFYRKYRMCFEHPRIKHFPKRKWLKGLPDNLNEQMFIKQLIDINEITGDDDDEIANLTTQKLFIEVDIMSWVQSGNLTPDQEKDFYNNSKLKWKNSFKLAHLDSKKALKDLTISDNVRKERINDNALKCLYDVRCIDLVIEDEQLDSELSNGEFYSLSNVPEIGWNLEWKEMYKGND